MIFFVAVVDEVMQHYYYYYNNGLVFSLSLLLLRLHNHGLKVFRERMNSSSAAASINHDF